jgi:hypothetical protein
MKQVALSDILTPLQIRKVKEICQKNADAMARIAALKLYLHGYRAHLERKGVDSDYLSYAIEANVQKALQPKETA